REVDTVVGWIVQIDDVDSARAQEPGQLKQIRDEDERKDERAQQTAGAWSKGHGESQSDSRVAKPSDLPLQDQRSAVVEKKNLVPRCLEVPRQVINNRYDSPSLLTPWNHQEGFHGGVVACCAFWPHLADLVRSLMDFSTF